MSNTFSSVHLRLYFELLSSGLTIWVRRNAKPKSTKTRKTKTQQDSTGFAEKSHSDFANYLLNKIDEQSEQSDSSSAYLYANL